MEQPDTQPGETAAERLNRQCACITLDRSKITRALADQLGDEGGELLADKSWQPFFSNVAVFIPPQDLGQMTATVQALEAATALPEYQQRVLSGAPPTARFNPGPVGAFMGFDFHLGEEGPRLIEINTNAGGAFLNAMLAQAQLQCCDDATRVAGPTDFKTAVITQFEREWRAQRGSGRPERIAIVDDQPAEQYLYPEFRLAQQLFRKNGIDALILSPSDLRYEGGTLYGDGKRIDLVYNRLVDFGLEAPEHHALRSAWLDGGAVITPNPYSHALYADKRNLAVLSDQTALVRWGLRAELAEVLHSGVPHTVQVTADRADELWQQRREWFFKPVAGHGSKGVYRVFSRILESDYVAQALVPPSERLVLVNGEREMLKVDVRLYAYRGELLLAAARLYRGQTTNFRTPGGGFAPVLLKTDDLPLKATAAVHEK